MEIQQSAQYIKFITSIGWKGHAIDDVYIISKKIPFFLSIAKIYRFNKLPDAQKTIAYLKSQHIRTVVIEPDRDIDTQKFLLWSEKLKKHFTISASPFLPTKSIRVDLTPSEEIIFQRFSEAKRRAVRRAQKNDISIKTSNDIWDLIKIKNKSAGAFGFITTQGIDKLWSFFYPQHASVLLAYSSSNKCIGGILLLYWDDVAYYWIAGATKEGKKLFAPTLLVWEALKLSKKHKCKEFDFVGVWDERLFKQFKTWKGFTKFKEGFGGKDIYYPIIEK